MASVALSTKALGSVITLKENGTAAEFVVACHDYESRLNGAGRTLLVRKAVLSDQVAWAYRVDSTTDLYWSGCRLNGWLNETYLGRFDSDIQRNIETTNYNPSNDKSRIFVLSEAEYTTALDANVLNALTTNGSDDEWTRNVAESRKEDGEDMEHWWYTRVRLAYKFKSEKFTARDSGFPDAENGHTAWIRPCFTVSGELRVNEGGGELKENHPPKIECEFQNGGSMGAHSKGFNFTYTVYDEDADNLRVTEYLDGALRRQFYARNGQQTVFALDDNAFEQLATEKNHVIRIQVYDGADGAEWTQTFYKGNKQGYRVYAGTLKTVVTGVGTALFPPGYAWATRECIYDPTCVDDELDNIIIDPQLEMEKNELGSFEFTLPVSNRFYNSLIPRRTVVSVEEDGIEIWMGYVTEIDKNFQMEKKVYCEGELGLLKDSSLVLEAKEYTAAELFSAIIGGALLKGWKSFRAGNISEKFKDVKIDLKEYGTQYTTVWEALDSLLLGNIGGMLCIRKIPTELDGRYDRFLDYFWSEGELGATTQCIEFGNNLLDLDYYVKAYDIVNRVTYYGYQTTGWWIFAHTDKISVTVEDEESVRIYGPIERCYVADGTASTTESLTKAAKEKLNELKLKMDYSFEISALDLRDAGVDTMRLGFMKRAQILSWPHELSQWALCTKLSIPLDKLDEKKFTFGSASETLSGKQATGTGAAKRAVDTLRSVVSYINR